MQRMFHQIHLSVELTHFFALCNFSSVTRRRKKCRNAHTCHLNTCCECALRSKINFEFATEQLSFKLRILTNVTADHFFYLSSDQQFAETKTINTGVI